MVKENRIMVTTFDDLKERMSKYFSETPTDDDIKMLEDFSDTFYSMSAEGQKEIQSQLDDANKSIKEWEQKYTDNDTAWRKRYMDRFNGKPVEDIPEVKQQIEQEAGRSITIEDLFTPKEG